MASTQLAGEQLKVAPARPPAAPPAIWRNSTLLLGLLGGLLFWLALPPLELSPLAWLAPVPWVVLGVRRELVGRRPYGALWLAGLLFWLATLYWLTLPHWATAFGWIALSCYLAAYWPAFVGLLRVAVRLRIPSIVAAPVVWAGLELAQAHLLGGFLMASLAHTQYRQLAVIQVSDLGGSYAVTFLMVWVAACIVRMLPLDGRRAAIWPVVPLVAALAAAMLYARARTAAEASWQPGPKVALIQGSIDTEMKSDPGEAQQIFDQYVGLTVEALHRNSDLDLIVWPETMFRYPWFLFDKDYRPTDPNLDSPEELEESSRYQIGRLVREMGVPSLIGIETHHYTRERTERYNSVLYVDRAGHVQGRYDKVHLVMFGEYVPCAEAFPWLYRLTPLATGLQAGQGPVAVQLGRARYAANVCYESTIPHLIRQQVADLSRAGQEPDVLVNLTNDGWFHGSSELDLHLACGVFRAVECRKPFLVAANTGFSACIDANGAIEQQGPRRQTGVVVAQTRLDSRRSWYVEYGDVPAGLCLAGCVGLAFAGMVLSRRPAGSRAGESARPVE